MALYPYRSQGMTFVHVLNTSVEVGGIGRIEFGEKMLKNIKTRTELRTVDK